MMTHVYAVSGMTCNGCRAAVESRLSAVPGVEKVLVDLEKGEAEIVMRYHIPTDVLQAALPGKYTISEKQVPHQMPMTGFEAETQKPEWQQLFPLFLIFTYITAASVLMNLNFSYTLGELGWLNTDGFMLDFMGLFYIVFSFFKMLDLKGFPDSFRMYDPLAKKVGGYALVYPFIETALGLMFLMRFQIEAALIVTIVVLGITTIGVTKVLLDKKSIRCACLGTALKLPMTKATFIENSVMIAMSGIMLFRMHLG